MSQEIVGQRIGGWLIRRHLGSGKSAVVFEGEKDGQSAALKVFDPELVERFGKSTQLVRIERECSLIGEHHSNLVQIFDGGECRESEYLYVAMELIDTPNIGDSLAIVPREKIATVLHQIASAARFLEEKNLAHRDIKPENIAVFSDFSHAVLLDLGVLRPFGGPSITDEDARVFVGTLRYSSPEFLLRTERDTIEGWRAITFYQLGAVLHDLIMRQPLFYEFTNPYAALVEAVKSEKPEIHAIDVSPDLVLLAQNCLVKTPSARLDLVTWDDFDLLSCIQRSVGSAKERAKKRALLVRLQTENKIPAQRQSHKKIAHLITVHLDSIIRNECAGSDSCPPMQIILNEDSQIHVTVIFADSPRYALPQQLSIRFNCELVDEAMIAVSISASTCLLAKDSYHGNPPTSVNVFRGPLYSGRLVSSVQGILWKSIDLAQSHGSSSATCDNVFWLDLNRETEG
jgi:serine/threonine protein kinase